MAKRILVPADGSTAAARVIRAITQELGMECEVLVGHVQTPDMSNDDRISAITHLIDHVGRARTEDIKCRLVRLKHDTVPDGIVEMAKQEKVDMIAMYTDPGRPPEQRPKGSFARQVKEMAQCEVRLFDVREIAASA